MIAPGMVWADIESPKLEKYREDVDRAVDSALAWLAKSQREDGSFPDNYGQTTAVVGLTGMAFLARGHMPGRPPYGDVLDKCVDFILANKQSNGYLDSPNSGGRMYAHCIATLFLSEVSGMVDPARQKKIDETLPKSLKIILTAQEVKKDKNHRGGWRYEPTSNDSDISVSGWALMALRSSRLNGAPVPRETIDAAAEYIMRCRNSDGGFSYQPRGGSGVARTGLGLLCLELTGRHDTEVTRKAGDYLLRHLRPNDLLDDGHKEYAVYYCAQGMFQLGGEYWEQFAEAMYQYLLRTQEKDGAWRSGHGAVYPTAMGVLSLAVAYRQLPIYQR